MGFYSKLRRGLGLNSPQPPLVWLDLCEVSVVDGVAMPCDLIVVPIWHERVAVARCLLSLPVRLVVEYDSRDRRIVVLAREAWGEVRWEDGKLSARPLSLRAAAELARTSVQLAKAQ